VAAPLAKVVHGVYASLQGGAGGSAAKRMKLDAEPTAEAAAAESSSTAAGAPLPGELCALGNVVEHVDASARIDVCETNNTDVLMP
jgi:hypothetical protein